MTEIILILGGFYLISKLLTTSKKASDEFSGMYTQVMSTYYQVILLKFKIFVSTVLFTAILIIVTMIKLDIKRPSINLATMMPSAMISNMSSTEEEPTTTEAAEEKHEVFEIGHRKFTYRNDNRYLMVNQETYTRKNLEGYPEIKWEGVKYWLLRK